MVDGVVASVYVDLLGAEAAAHRSAAKYRLLASLAPRLNRWLHARGLNQPLLLFMARTLPKVCLKSVRLLSSRLESYPEVAWHPHSAPECSDRCCYCMADFGRVTSSRECPRVLTVAVADSFQRSPVLPVFHAIVGIRRSHGRWRLGPGCCGRFGGPSSGRSQSCPLAWRRCGRHRRLCRCLRTSVCQSRSRLALALSAHGLRA